MFTSPIMFLSMEKISFYHNHKRRFPINRQNKLKLWCVQLTQKMCPKIGYNLRMKNVANLETQKRQRWATGYKDLYLDICTSNKEYTQAIKQSKRVLSRMEILPLPCSFLLWNGQQSFLPFSIEWLCSVVILGKCWYEVILFGFCIESWLLYSFHCACEVRAIAHKHSRHNRY